MLSLGLGNAWGSCWSWVGSLKEVAGCGSGGVEVAAWRVGLGVVSFGLGSPRTAEAGPFLHGATMLVLDERRWNQVDPLA